MICKRCKRQNPDNYSRCMYCNTPLYSGSPDRKKRENKIFGALIALILVFTIVVGVYAYQRFAPSKSGFGVGGGGGGGGMVAVSGGITPTPLMPVTLDGEDPEVEINFFNTDTYDVLAGTEVDVTFTAEVFSENELDAEDVAVYDSKNNRIGVMCDDGTSGDAEAGDGIYTLVTRVNSSVRSTMQYIVRARSVVSNPLNLFFYQNITSEDFTFYSETAAKVMELNNINDIKAHLSSNVNIESYNVASDNKSVQFTFKSGITCVWEDSTSAPDGVQLKGGVGSIPGANFFADYTEARNQVANASLYPTVSDGDVCVVRPYRSTDFQYDDFKEAGNLISKALGGETVVRDDDKANLETFKGFDDFGVVLIDSHGGMGNNKPFIVTGETYERAQAYSSADYQDGRIQIILSGNKGRAAVTEKFFDRYYADHSLDETAFFLGSCNSMTEDTIADVLLRKGAKVVYGFSKPVSVDYCNNILRELFINQHLLAKAPVSEAFSKAREVCGTTDPYVRGCELKKKGDDTFRLVTDAGAGNAQGKVMTADDRAPLKMALVRVFRDGMYVTSARTDANGNYSVRLAAGNYVFKISKGHYKSAKIAVTVDHGVTVYNETFLMLRFGNAEGSAFGYVTNALTGEYVNGVTLSLRKHWNNREGAVVGNVSSVSDGYYEFKGKTGFYTIEFRKDGFITGYKNIIIGVEDMGAQNVAISPEMPDDGQFRIVLSWSNMPKDLDSHLTGPDASGSRFHLYYVYAESSNRNVNSEYYSLDLDNTDIVAHPNTPETTTIKQQLDGVYRYSVHDFSNSGNASSDALSKSNATVSVYKGSVLVATFHVPTDQKGSIWTVFEISGNQIKPINKFGNGNDRNINNF